jgi:hypothetical protein
MKSLLLSVLFLSAIALSVVAQSFELSNVHGVIPANSEMIQVGSPDSSYLDTYIHVKNISAGEMHVKCKKSQLSMLDSTEMTMCWAGACYPSSVHISPTAQIIAAGATYTEFSGHYSATNATYHFTSGESVIRWVFYNEANVNDSTSVLIKYISYPLGTGEETVRQTSLASAYPNPAGASATIGYSVPSGSDASIVVRNLLGATIHSEQLTTETGKFIFNTANLGDGIYFYSLLVDGKLSQTKKLIVKHF